MDGLKLIDFLLGKVILETHFRSDGNEGTASVRPTAAFLERYEQTRIPIPSERSGTHYSNMVPPLKGAVDNCAFDEAIRIQGLLWDLAIERAIDTKSPLWAYDLAVRLVGEHLGHVPGPKRTRGRPRKGIYARYYEVVDFLIHVDWLKAVMQAQRGCEVTDVELADQIELRIHRKAAPADPEKERPTTELYATMVRNRAKEISKCRKERQILELQIMMGKEDIWSDLGMKSPRGRRLDQGEVGPNSELKSGLHRERKRYIWAPEETELERYPTWKDAFQKIRKAQ